MVSWNYFWILALLFPAHGANDIKFADTVHNDDRLVRRSLKITLLNTIPSYSSTKSPNVSIVLTPDKYNLSLYDEYEDHQESSLYSERIKKVMQKFLEKANRKNNLKLLTCYYCGINQDAKSCIDIKPGDNDKTLTCAGPETWCFATVLLEDNHPRCVLRGCQPDLLCKTTPLTICCNTNLCNDQNLSNFEDIHKSLLHHWRRKNDDIKVYNMFSSEASEVPPTALFFVTVLLILQTVVKVAIA